MNIYPLALFVHVVAAIGYYIGIGTWWLVLVGLRRAERVEQVRALMKLTDASGPLGAGSAFLLLASGLYMALTQWSLQTPWIRVALISVLLMVPASALVIAPRRAGIAKQLAREAPTGTISPDLRPRLHDPVLFGLVQTVAILLLGLVFLMTTKPDLSGSIIVIVLALMVGLGSSLLTARSGRSATREFDASKESLRSTAQ
jgi:hypothetical protein